MKDRPAQVESQEENVTKAGDRKTYRRSAVPLMNVDRKGIGLFSSSFFESLNFVDGFKGEIQEVGLVFTDTISGRTFFSNSSVFPELPVFELHSSIDRWSFHFTLPCKSSIFPTGGRANTGTAGKIVLSSKTIVGNTFFERYSDLKESQSYRLVAVPSSSSSLPRTLLLAFLSPLT
ncbi:hypothetical protein SDJN03_18714, partial [Cucurbita argyrosperma subsp. sororia]